jgi:ribonuclease BN (tRNA processing enzyme)
VIVNDGESTVAVTGDTASLSGLREAVTGVRDLRAILVECAFPNELAEIAKNSHHMTPVILAEQLTNFKPGCPILAVNIKPRYREQVVGQLKELNIEDLEVMSVGKPYFW